MEKAETNEKGVVTGRLYCAYVGHRIFVGLTDPVFTPFGTPASDVVLEDALEALVQRAQGPEGIQVKVTLVPIFPSNNPIPRLKLSPDFMIKSEGDEGLENYFKTATHRSVLIAPQGRLNIP